MFELEAGKEDEEVARMGLEATYLNGASLCLNEFLFFHSKSGKSNDLYVHEMSSGYF